MLLGKINNYGFCQTGQLTPAVHVCNWIIPRAYLGTPLTCHQHQENHLNKNFIPIEKEYWIVTLPFEWQSKMCRLSSNTVVPFARKIFDHKILPEKKNTKPVTSVI